MRQAIDCRETTCPFEPVNKAKQLAPPESRVVVLGDGELDGIDLHALASHGGSEYIRRASKTTKLIREGEESRFVDLCPKSLKS